MKTLTYDDVIRLNKQLEEYKVHVSLHDACGGQSFSIKEEQIPAEVYGIVDSFFSSLGVKLEYDRKKRSFWTVN